MLTGRASITRNPTPATTTAAAGCTANGAARLPELGLAGEPDYEHFKNLMHGLHPHTRRAAHRQADRRSAFAAWDVTASVPKGVTIALERGDTPHPGGDLGIATGSDGACSKTTPPRASGLTASKRTA